MFLISESFLLKKATKLINNHQYTDAVEFLLQFISNYPFSYPSIYLMLGKCLRIQRNFKLALKFYFKGLFIFPNCLKIEGQIESTYKNLFKKFKHSLLNPFNTNLCDRIIIIDHGKLIYDGNLNEIIKKYAGNKNLTAVFLKDVKKSDLEKIGTVTDFEPLKATISVPRAVHGQAAAELLSKFPVDDLDISEVSLEDVIRKIFGEKR